MLLAHFAKENKSKGILKMQGNILTIMGKKGTLVYVTEMALKYRLSS